MKPAWDQLGDEFAGSKTVIIADVDCTVEKDLCSKYGVRGYPTIKTFTGNPDGDAYEGGRDFDALKKFADESLGPSCSNDNIDLCDDDQKKILDKYNAMSAGERKKLVDEANKAVEDAEENFKAEVKKLQSQYETLMSDKVRFAAPHSLPRLANRLLKQAPSLFLRRTRRSRSCRHRSCASSSRSRTTARTSTPPCSSLLLRAGCAAAARCSHSHSGFVSAGSKLARVV